MTTDTNDKAPVWFWILGILILLWNLFGIFVFAIMVLIVSGNLDIANEQALAQMNEAQRSQTIVTKEVILSTPMWSNVAFAIAVGFGSIASITLLMRRSIALPLFVISLIGVLVQNSYNYLLSDAVQKMGVGLSPIVILVAILMIPVAWFCARRGLIR